jgi:DNA-binding transcriptional MerR regulator
MPLPLQVAALKCTRFEIVEFKLAAMASEDRTRTHPGSDLPVGNKDSAGERDACGGLTIGELAREAGVTLRALRFYQSKGLLGRRDGSNASRTFSEVDRDRLALILQGKRLGFTLSEIRDLLAVPASRCAKVLPIGRRKCVDQINLLERQRRDIERAIAELRQIYTEMLTDSDAASRVRVPGTR